MRIDQDNTEPVWPKRAVAATADQQKSHHPRDDAPGASVGLRGDSVQLSAARQPLADRSVPAESDLDADRVSALRARVLGGSYDTLDIVDEVARRILARGEL